jgi:hypothetical protein
LPLEWQASSASENATLVSPITNAPFAFASTATPTVNGSLPEFET